MPRGSCVRPNNWEADSVLDLYDDGDYSAIWGRLAGEAQHSLGVRWNGSDDNPGYPNYGKNPVWYTEPDFLVPAVLSSFLDQVKKAPEEKLPRRREYIDNILTALRECGVEME